MGLDFTDIMSSVLGGVGNTAKDYFGTEAKYAQADNLANKYPQSQEQNKLAILKALISSLGGKYGSNVMGNLSKAGLSDLLSGYGIDMSNMSSPVRQLTKPQSQPQPNLGGLNIRKVKKTDEETY